MTNRPPSRASDSLFIEKLVFGGQGLGKSAGKICLVWNALPDENVRIKVLKQKHNYLEAVATEILSPSPRRIAPREDHFLSCSPWQILSFEAENEWKIRIAEETYARLGHLPTGKKIEIVSDTACQYGYRNKMEFNFLGSLLAFFERGTHAKNAVMRCELASAAICENTPVVLEWLKKQDIAPRALKSLTIRSNPLGQTIAALFLNEELRFRSAPALTETWVGFQAFYSNPKSPAPSPDRLLYSCGQNYLVVRLRNTDLKHGMLSFFQINTALFERTLEDISGSLDKDKPLIDYYAGVGAISLSLHDRCKNTVLVDNHAEAIEYAKENIRLNQLNHCQALLSPAEKMTEFISKNSIVAFDPPRAGLHPRVIKRVLAEKPIRLIYLSCNLSTHARDIQLLSPAYKVSSLKLYNFFPRTPHIEALCVLDRI